MNEVPSSQEVSKVPLLWPKLLSLWTRALAHFLMQRVREKNATGLPFWLSVAASAASDASVSTSNGILSSTAVTTASS